MGLRKGKKIGELAGDKYASQIGSTYGGFDETGLSLVYSYFALRVPRGGAVLGGWPSCLSSLRGL